MFGERLKQLREQKGLTQEDLGKRLKLTKANISKYESNKLEPNLETINYLAGFFDVTTDYLLGRTHNRTEVLSELSEQELEVIFRTRKVTFLGEDLDDEDKEDVINFLQMLRRKKQK